MKALGASHLKFFVSKQREKERVGFGGSRHECGFLVRRKGVGGGLVLFRANSISSPPSSQKNLGSEEIQRVNLDQPKTVRVKFKLQKQCEFGEQFLLVGDDPNLGLWDPCNGVPLIWSEGHVWTVEVDLLSSKVINYKFILEEIDGTVSWQPGPDRVLETWDTAKVISVFEDWDSPDFQDVVEEEFVSDSSLLIAEGVDQSLVEGGNVVVEEEEVDASSLGLLIHENWNEVAVGEEYGAVKEKADANESRSDDLDDPIMLMVAENISDVDESSASDEAMSSLENEMRLVIDEVAPVLVSGLAAVPSKEVEKEEKETEASRIDRSAISEVQESSVSEETMSSLKNETRLVIDEVAPVLVSGLAAVPSKEVEEEEKETEASRIDSSAISEVQESSVSDETMSRLKNETRLAIDDVAPVLVSGLAALPSNEVEEEEAETEASTYVGSTTTEFDEIKSKEVEEEEAETETEASRNVISATTEFDEIKDSSDQDQRNDEIFEDAATEFDKLEDPTDLNTRNNDDTTNEPEAATEPEIRVSAALHCPEMSETKVVVEEKTQLDGKKHILEIDMQWGRRTLHKFLANLGFMQHS